MVEKKDKRLKAFVMFIDDNGKSNEAKIAAYAEKAKASDIMLTYVGRKHEGIGLYKVNTSPEVKNTIMVYRRKQVTAKFVNLVANEKGLGELKQAIADITQ